MKISKSDFIYFVRKLLFFKKKNINKPQVKLKIKIIKFLGVVIFKTNFNKDH